MLAKQFRLPSSVLFNNAQFFKETFFSAKVQKNEFLSGRFGFVVSKAIDRRSTVRNRLKRVFRSVIEEKWLKRTRGLDILFILKPAAKTAKREEIKEKITAVMEKLTI